MHETGYLGDILVLLAALLVFVPLFQKLRVGTVLGYLVGGAIVGPAVLGLVDHVGVAVHLGEFGVAFLLFAVGLELKLERLRLFGARVFIMGAIQVVVTTAVFTAIAAAFGLSLTVAVLIGGALSLSSTAIVFQLLGERTVMAGQFGRTALAILLVQDIMVGPLLVFVSVAGAGAETLGPALLEAAAKSAVLIGLLILFARTLLRSFFRLAAGAGAPEVFTGAALLLVLGVGWATEAAGLSMALGAFLAGMMVADTEYRHQVAIDIAPFRGLFLGLFFMTIGMTLDLALAASKPGTILAVVAVIIVVKALVVTGLAMAFGRRRWDALALGGLLGQGSEFTFVVLVLAVGYGLLESSIAPLLTVAVGLSMVVTVVGAAIVRPWAQRRAGGKPRILGNLAVEGGELRGHVVIAGFGQVGMGLARHLAGLKIPIVVLDLNPRRVGASRSRRLPVFYGDAARSDVLSAAHAERADALVVAVSDGQTTERITAMARRKFPHLHIVARVPDDEWVGRIRRAGANAVVRDGLLTAQEMAERIVVLFDPDAIADAFAAGEPEEGPPPH